MPPNANDHLGGKYIVVDKRRIAGLKFTDPNVWTMKTKKEPMQNFNADGIFFSLRLDSDPAARAAGLAYCDLVQETAPQLANELRGLIERIEASQFNPNPQPEPATAAPPSAGIISAALRGVALDIREAANHLANALSAASLPELAALMPPAAAMRLSSVMYNKVLYSLATRIERAAVAAEYNPAEHPNGP